MENWHRFIMISSVISFLTSIPSLIIANTSDINDCTTRLDPSIWLNIYGSVGILTSLIICVCLYGDDYKYINTIGVFWTVFWIAMSITGFIIISDGLLQCSVNGDAIATMLIMTVALSFLPLLSVLFAIFLENINIGYR